jgi:zinc transporter
MLADLGINDPSAIEALTRTDTRPRTTEFENAVLVALRAINLNPGADAEDMVSLRLWIESDRLISVRNRRVISAQDIRDQLIEGRGPASIPGLVVQLIERIADRISDHVEMIEGKLDQIESGPLSRKDKSELLQIRRQVASVRRFLAPQREALDVLTRVAPSSTTQDIRMQVREQNDRIIRYIEDLDLIKERAMVLQEEIMNSIMEEQNARMYALSIVAVIFLPITFITGIFGMNVAGLPGIENPEAFLWVSGSMLTISVAVILMLRIRGWF